MTKEQFCKVAHISKSAALFLIKSELIPCQDSGKQTRRYTIQTKDVIFYLKDRVRNPTRYCIASGWRPHTKGHKSSSSRPTKALDQSFDFSPAQIEAFCAYLTDRFQAAPDLLSVHDLADLLGYGETTIINWCNRDWLFYYTVGRKYYVPKELLIQFLMSDMAMKIRRKSLSHQTLILSFMKEMNII